MFVGKAVVYVDAKKDEHDATVTEITGSGPSRYKTLNLRFTSRKKSVDVQNVVHENDKGTAGFWK